MGRPVGVKETHPRAKGGGRKPKAITILKRKMVEDKIAAAELAFSYLVSVVENELVPTPVRVDASQLVLNRVLGRAVEMPVTSDDKKRYDDYHKKLDDFIKGKTSTMPTLPMVDIASNGNGAHAAAADHNGNGNGTNGNGA